MAGRKGRRFISTNAAAAVNRQQQQLSLQQLARRRPTA